MTNWPEDYRLQYQFSNSDGDFDNATLLKPSFGVALQLEECESSVLYLMQGYDIYRYESSVWVLKGTIPASGGIYQFVAGGNEVACIEGDNGSGEQHFWISLDNGVTWTDKGVIPGALFWFTGGLGRNFEGVYFVTVENDTEDALDTYKSVDQGDNWTLVLDDHGYSGAAHTGPNTGVGGFSFSQANANLIAMPGSFPAALALSVDGSSFTEYNPSSGGIGSVEGAYSVRLGNNTVLIWVDWPNYPGESNTLNLYASIFDGVSLSTPVLIFALGAIVSDNNLFVVSDGNEIFIYFNMIFQFPVSNESKLFRSTDAVNWSEISGPGTFPTGFTSGLQPIVVSNGSQFLIGDGAVWKRTGGVWSDTSAPANPDNIFATDQGSGL